jgi:uncharacterized RDD family membrane protein YckC
MYANIASAKDRLTAFYFNFLIFGGLVFLLSNGLASLAKQFIGKVSMTSCAITAVVLVLLINILLLLKTQNDFVKCIIGLEIRNLHDDKAVNWYQILVRALLSYVSVVILGLGSIAMIFNSERLTLQDLCANTLVVENPNYNRQFFLIKAFHFISLLLGSLVSLAVFTILICAPVPLLSNYLYETNITGYDSVAFYRPASELEPELIKEELRIPVSNGQIYALINLKNNAEYLDFRIDRNSENNYINQQTLDKLGIPQTKISRYFQPGEEFWTFTVLPYVNLHSISLKDVDSVDINIHNQIFHLHTGENKLGRDFLGLFDYAIDTEASQLVLKPYEYDAALFPEKLKPKSKIILSQIYRKLYADWALKLKARGNPAVTEQKLNYDIVFDSNSGHIVELTLLEPNIDQPLVVYAEKFLKDYTVITKLNKELRKQPKIKLKLSLAAVL